MKTSSLSRKTIALGLATLTCALLALPAGAAENAANPCAVKAANPCAEKPINPCDAKHAKTKSHKKAANPCADKPMNPCAEKAGNPCANNK